MYDLAVHRRPVVRRIVRILGVGRRCGLDGVPEEGNARQSRARLSGADDGLFRVRASERTGIQEAGPQRAGGPSVRDHREGES